MLTCKSCSQQFKIIAYIRAPQKPKQTTNCTTVSHKEHEEMTDVFQKLPDKMRKGKKYDVEWKREREIKQELEDLGEEFGKEVQYARNY